jgi:predicted dehydrogenase
MAVRIAFVGAGGIAGAHLEALAKIAQAQVAALCDVNEERVKQAAGKRGVPAYTDHHEMLQKEEIQALYVCTPPFAHTDAEIIAAQKGIHLFIEKPVAISLEKAIEIRGAIEQAGVVSSVGYHWRYLDRADKLKQALADQEIGMVLGWWLGGLPGVAWWRVMRESGGQMHEQTTHIIDFGRYLAGDIDEVFAAYALRALRDVQSLDVPDVGTVTLRFKSGAVGTISNTCMLGGYGTAGVQVICRDLFCRLEGDSLLVVRKGEKKEFKGDADVRLKQNEAFINAIVSGDRSGIRSTYADAVKSLAVSLAANESADTGSPVKVAV